MEPSNSPRIPAFFQPFIADLPPWLCGEEIEKFCEPLCMPRLDGGKSQINFNLLDGLTIIQLLLNFTGIPSDKLFFINSLADLLLVRSSGWKKWVILAGTDVYSRFNLFSSLVTLSVVWALNTSHTSSAF